MKASAARRRAVTVNFESHEARGEQQTYFQPRGEKKQERFIDFLITRTFNTSELKNVSISFRFDHAGA
jgi:hypothetical protein